MRKAELVLLAVVLVALSLYGGYTFGNKRGYSAGMSEGERLGYDKGFQEAPKPDPFAQAQLRNDYNKLVDDYNNLLEQANASAARRQPISCTSYSYGINDAFTSTNCY